ncbi:MAG: sensor of ECF-type sigma factor [Bacteroidota bacterium]
MRTILLIALLVTTTIYGQRKERIKALKVTHITNALNLTAAEAEKFWPIYNTHEEKLFELRKKERQEIFVIVKGDVEGLSDGEANALIEKGINFKSTELQHYKELVNNLRGVIPPYKILKLHRAEEAFKRKLLEIIKKRREQRKN